MRYTMTGTAKAATLGFALWMPSVGLAQQGAFGQYEVGTRMSGNAAAGAGSDATGAGVAYHNPAAMTYLEEGHHISLGAQLTTSLQTFTPGDRTTVPGTGSENRLLWPGGGIYSSFQLSQRTRLGFVANMPYSISATYDPEWVGRFDVEKIQFLGVNLMPSMSIELTEWVSLGVAAHVFWAGASYDSALRLEGATAGDPEGDAHIQASGWSATATVGFTFKPVDSTLISFTYRGPLYMTLKGKSDFTGDSFADYALPSNTPLSASYRLPQGINLSVKSDLSPALAILADVGWSNWDAFELVTDPEEGDYRVLMGSNFQDTLRLGLGIHVNIADVARIRAGAGYDTSPIKQGERRLALPLYGEVRGSIGVEGRIAEVFSLGASYTIVVPDRAIEVDTPSLVPSLGRVQGTFGSVLHVPSLTFGFHF